MAPPVSEAVLLTLIAVLLLLLLSIPAWLSMVCPVDERRGVTTTTGSEQVLPEYPFAHVQPDTL